MGRNHNTCCVINCKNNGKNSTCKFYSFPVAVWKIPQRNKWIAAINRKNPDGSLWHPKPHDTICSAHFVGGQKSDAEASPSYVPSIFPPNHSQVASKLIYFIKQINSDQPSEGNESKQNNIVEEECQAGTSNQLKQTKMISSEVPEVTFSTEVKVEPSDCELDNYSTEDILHNCEVIIEQPGHANNEEPEIHIEPTEVKIEPSDDEFYIEESEIIVTETVIQGNREQVQSDPISFEVKTEPRDDEVETTQLQKDQISVVVKTEPQDDEEETAQVQRAGISVVVKAEPCDEVEDTLPNQQHDVSVGQELETPLKQNKKRQREPELMESSLRSPSPQRPRYSHTSHRGDDSFREYFYGSDLDSDESDEEDLSVPFFPRAQRSALETPVDPYTTPNAAPVAATSSTTSNIHDIPLKETAQPWNPYQFNWKPFPNVPIPPESRREVFSHRNVGPTAPCVDPYEIFIAIWDRQFMEHIASETNRYAQQVTARMLENSRLRPKSRITKWRDTTVDELYVFFGIMLAMGIVVKTRIEEYWSTSPDIFFTPGFSTRMRASRFLLLAKCLHFSNNEDLFAQNLEVSEAKLFKVQPVLSHLNKKFSSMYRLGQNIVLDESLLQWNGRLDINQLVPSQSASLGIKTYEICESQSGFLWRFEIHSHKKSKSPPQQFEDPMKASTPAIVLRLLHGLEGKGHTLWMDSYYNSPSLARRLKSLGFDCAGTLRTNRAFVPQVLHRLTKDNMQEGQISGFTSGDVDVVVWKNINKISMISTYHGIATRTLESTKPLLINEYNNMMARVDKKDQMLATYPIERKRMKVWYKKLFRRLLNVSVLNAFIIHRESVSSFSPSSSTLLSHRNFRSSLVKALLSRHCSAAPLPGTSQIHLNKTFDVSHRLAEYPFGSKTNKRQRLRRKCVKCTKLVQTYCVGCNATICMEPCFLAFHS